MMSWITILSVFFVTFTDKNGSQPIEFSERALFQRDQWNISIDSLDYAVSPTYIDSLRSIGAFVYHTSRWMNGATVSMTDAQAEIIGKWSFVQSIELTRDSTIASPVLQRKLESRSASNAQSSTTSQLAQFNLLPLHNAGYEGQGILMAICDAGFTNANTLTCFDHNKCLGTFDFSDEKVELFASSSHGTECLSTIAAQTNTYHGAAPQVSYYLMRSEENNSESPKEMDNLLAALEKADSLGVNIFSVSLGYYEFDNSLLNLTYAKMDGHSTRASRGATIAARKGMLVVAAMGNEGNKSWHYLCAPADADSILSVGAVKADSTIANFSSRGPSYDGRVKPEVCARGYQTSIITPEGIIINGNGTSFATPLIAGLAATLWSAMPMATAHQVRALIIHSCHHYLCPDGEYGYGIPNAEMLWRQNTGDSSPITNKANVPRKVLIQGHLYIEKDGNLISAFLLR